VGCEEEVVEEDAEEPSSLVSRSWRERASAFTYQVFS
jgi:hypothetical protein